MILVLRIKDLKILIVDENDDVQYLYQKILKLIDTEPIPANNTQEAIERYIEAKPDLTLVDIKMPLKEGIEAINKIVEYDSNARIIAHTVYDLEDDELGVPVMQKVFGKEDFLDMIETGLNGEETT